MANLNDTIKDHVFGDALTITRTVENMPNVRTLVKAWFSIRFKDALNNTDLDDVAVVLQKEITSSIAAQGQITDIGTGTEPNRNGAVLFKLATGDTLVLVEGFQYTWDIQVLLDNGDVATVFKGPFIGQYGVTVRSS